ncbi:hypothetical protein Tco_1346965 [Tanacetum coccineum]
MTSTNSSTATLPFLQNILDLYFKHFKLPEDVVNRILQVVLDLQHFKSSLFIFAATILQSSSAIHHISNIDNYVHQIIKFQSILITSSHSLWSSQSFGHQKGVCPWLTENHFNSQYLKHWASLIHKRMMVTNTNDMVVATVLQNSFGKYLVRLNHNKAATVLRVEVTRGDFYWQIDKRPNDSGVFLMRHMEAYIGNVMSKWDCD